MAEAMDKVNVTYDSIFELLMREKSREELQTLSPDFFNHLVSYVAEKKKTADTKSMDTFSLEEKKRAARQLQNVNQMLTELYERREKKVLNMSMIKSRTGADIVDTTPLLGEEKMLFDAIVAQLDYYRNCILHRVLNAENADTGQKEIKADTKVVRFIHPVPKFVGKELEVYGPYVEEDIAGLPAEIADVLIEKRRAEEMS